MTRRKPLPPYTIAKVTKNGSITVPAPFRNRWGTQYLRVEDHGDYAVLRPADESELDEAR